MPTKKLKWSDSDDIAFRLIDEHPDVNPMSLSQNEIKRRILDLPDFSDDPKKLKDSTLETVQKIWFDERNDMEDELGPLPTAVAVEEDELDEDQYRDDRMVETLAEEEELFEDDDDADEDELDEGFQHEGEEDED